MAIEPAPQGICHGHENPDLWFSDRADEIAEAITICGNCPTRTSCYEYAQRHRTEITDGIWGGVQIKRGKPYTAGNPNAIPQEKRDHICRDYLNGASLGDLARKYHHDYRTIARVLNVANVPLRPPRRRLPTHCANGHEYTPENTKLGTDGHRQCIVCYNAHLAREREQRRRARARKKAAA